MPDLRLIFFGTAELACPILAALARCPNGQVVAVVTQPDRPQGRELKLTPSPVKRLALELGRPVLQPEKARDPAFLSDLSVWRPDLIIVAAYGQILPQALLDLPAHGCLNVHASLLPKYRGAAPIQWALLNDDTETGVTIMKMEAGLDTGPILTQRATPILPTDTAQTLHERLAALGAELLIETIPAYLAGRLQPRPQPVEGVSFARKIVKDDGRLDWTRPARALWNQIRAFTPWPGSFTWLPGVNERRLLKVWQADIVERARGQPGEILQADEAGVIVACGQDALRLLCLQREGAKRLAPAAFLAGMPLTPGQRLGEGPLETSAAP